MTNKEAIEYIKSRCIGSASERDGTQWSDAMWTAIEALSNADQHVQHVGCVETPTVSEKHQLSEEIPTNTPTDLINRQDAIRWVKTECNPYGKPTLEFESGKKVIEHLEQMPSADEQDDNRLYIKIYANDEPSRKAEKLYQICGETESQEVAQWLKEYFPSADRSAEWIPFTKRPLTDEEKEEYPDWVYMLDCPLPYDEQEILLSNGRYVWTDTFINDGECYLDGGDDIDEGMAWMPMPEPYKERNE